MPFIISACDSTTGAACVARARRHSPLFAGDRCQVCFSTHQAERNKPRWEVRLNFKIKAHMQPADRISSVILSVRSLLCFRHKPSRGGCAPLGGVKQTEAHTAAVVFRC